MEIFADASIARNLQRALAGDTFRTEMTLAGPVFDSWYSPLRNAKGAVAGVIGVAGDITEYVRLSERLRDAAKMEAIGRLAGGVAHDFNNQLTAILGFAEILEQSFDEDDPRAEDVMQIIRGRRAAALTQQLLAFGRKQVRRPTVLDLNTVLTNLETLLLHTVREDVQLDTQLAPDLWAVTADEVQIEQVIMAHLFEPFFTTKDEGKGTGMGLASAYGIITQSGGFIEVATELGRGTTFTFYLPSVSMPAASEAAPHTDESGHAESH